MLTLDRKCPACGREYEEEFAGNETDISAECPDCPFELPPLTPPESADLLKTGRPFERRKQ
jgi:hypothetical protein